MTDRDREAIVWWTTRTALGPIALAATGAGLRRLAFLDGADAEDAIRAAHPAAALEKAGAQSALPAWGDAVAAFIAGEAPRPDLPLDLRGTPFQRSVWAALSAIAPGERPTYAEIARRIGRPRACRAVGAANARNPVAVVVPCHLVVASDGLGGYAGGLARKRRLLAAEAAQSRGPCASASSRSPKARMPSACIRTAGSSL